MKKFPISEASIGNFFSLIYSYFRFKILVKGDYMVLLDAKGLRRNSAAVKIKTSNLVANSYK